MLFMEVFVSSCEETPCISFYMSDFFNLLMYVVYGEHLLMTI